MTGTKTLSEIKSALVAALNRWLLDYSPPARRFGEQGRSTGGDKRRILIPHFRYEDVTYQLYWLLFAKELPHKVREAAELYHIARWGYEEIAWELGISPRSVESYRYTAINRVALRIHERQVNGNRCPRCGGSLIMTKTAVTETEARYTPLTGEHIRCLNCSRTLDQIERDVIGESDGRVGHERGRKKP